MVSQNFCNFTKELLHFIFCRKDKYQVEKCSTLSTQCVTPCSAPTRSTSRPSSPAWRSKKERESLLASSTTPLIWWRTPFHRSPKTALSQSSLQRSPTTGSTPSLSRTILTSRRRTLASPGRRAPVRFTTDEFHCLKSLKSYCKNTTHKMI